MKRIGYILRFKLNTLARMFYKIHGYEVSFGYDFSSSTHPMEQTMWNCAVVAFAEIKNDEGVLKYQITN